MENDFQGYLTDEDIREIERALKSKNQKILARLNLFKRRKRGDKKK